MQPATSLAHALRRNGQPVSFLPSPVPSTAAPSGSDVIVAPASHSAGAINPEKNSEEDVSRVRGVQGLLQ